MDGGLEEGARGLLPKGPSFQVSLFQGAVDSSPFATVSTAPKPTGLRPPAQDRRAQDLVGV